MKCIKCGGDTQTGYSIGGMSGYCEDCYADQLYEEVTLKVIKIQEPRKTVKIGFSPGYDDVYTTYKDVAQVITEGGFIRIVLHNKDEILYPENRIKVVFIYQAKE